MDDRPAQRPQDNMRTEAREAYLNTVYARVELERYMLLQPSVAENRACYQFFPSFSLLYFITRPGFQPADLKNKPSLERLLGDVEAWRKRFLDGDCDVERGIELFDQYTKELIAKGAFSII